MISSDEIVSLFRDARRRAVRPFTIKGTSVRFKLDPDVFPPMPVSLALAESLPDLAGTDVADIGTGSGVLAIAAALSGASTVLATDLNPMAVANASQNFHLNNLNNRCRVVLCHILNESTKLFDVIVSNPPCMPILPSTEEDENIPAMLRLATDGGTLGVDVTIDWLTVAISRLKQDGRLFMPLPEWSDVKAIQSVVKNGGLSIQILKNIEVPYWIPLVFPRTPSPIGFSASKFRVSIVEITRQRIFEQSTSF